MKFKWYSRPAAQAPLHKRLARSIPSKRRPRSRGYRRPQQ